MKAIPVPILTDNYAWLLRCERSGAVAIVDPAEEAPIVAAIEAAGGRLDAILLTHHHGDHVAATDAVRARFGAVVVGARADRHRLPALDREVAEGDAVRVGEAEARVLETPGHTVGHVSFVFEGRGADAPPLLLAGDTLFSLGCGRLLEGTPAQMFGSLRRLASLPDETVLACGHEYTLSNARYARQVDPDNAELAARAAEVEALRARGRPTLPVGLGQEKSCNPFLRAPDVARFAELRAGKDVFRG